MHRNRRIQSVRPGLLVCDRHRLSTPILFFRGRRQPFISNYIVNCYTSSYYAILLYCSMLQHVAVSYSIHSITPSPDILTISRCLWMSLVLAFSHQCVPFRLKPWPGHLATNVTSAWDQCLCLIQNLAKLESDSISLQILHISLQILHNFYTCIWDFAPVLCCS